MNKVRTAIASLALGALMVVGVSPVAAAGKQKTALETVGITKAELADARTRGITLAALAAEQGVSTTALIAALVAGYEVMVRIAGALPPETSVGSIKTGTAGTIAGALAAGKLLALPRFNAATQAYEAVRVLDPARELSDGPFKVREPVAECPVVPMNRLDLALVPGLGFDARGGRVGRGKGHYDRLLAGFTGLKIGVAFDCQIVPEIPREPHDIALDAVVTPTRWIEAKRD